MKKLLIAVSVLASFGATANTPVSFEKVIAPTCGITLDKSKGELAFTDTVSGVTPVRMTVVNNDSTKNTFLKVKNISKSGIASGDTVYFNTSDSGVDLQSGIANWSIRHGLLTGSGVQIASGWQLQAGVNADTASQQVGTKTVNATLELECK